MNIFILDQNPTQAARYHCDKHVVKMILESCQMLSTTIHHYDPIFHSRNHLYKPCFHNHPCTIWTKESVSNMQWHVTLLESLLKEYESRYWKLHDSYHIFPAIYDWSCHADEFDFPSGTLTPFAQAMPPAYKHDNAIIAYRNYYMGEKKTFAKWNHSDKPAWWIP